MVTGAMAAPCVVGVDMGGTKLLAGALDENLNVHHRAHRDMRGLDQEGLLDAVVAAVEEVRAAAEASVDAVGFGIPCTIDQTRGMAVQAVNLPLADVPFRDIMVERLGRARRSWTTTPTCAALAEHRFGAARGTRALRDADRRARGSAAGSCSTARLYRGSVGAGAELGHMVVEMDGPPCQGNCPNRGCLEAVASGTALAREAPRGGRAGARTRELGRARRRATR